ncbi:hypothetical protein [Sneathiella aquimaris]|uniref:hypothetical protein n=1 Tax=Sneathiella aquimaris TaxID=2599305 RepID=UPI00146F38AB|nr:hypothetical protein [Sneathiella aquimaris]
MMFYIRKLILTSLLLMTAVGVSGCSSTWEGLKSDTKKNLEKTDRVLSGKD